jgi:hypothetical protein
MFLKSLNQKTNSKNTGTMLGRISAESYDPAGKSRPVGPCPRHCVGTPMRGDRAPLPHGGTIGVAHRRPLGRQGFHLHVRGTARRRSGKVAAVGAHLNDVAPRKGVAVVFLVGGGAPVVLIGRCQSL